jgi:hypothetical protein
VRANVPPGTGSRQDPLGASCERPRAAPQDRVRCMREIGRPCAILSPCGSARAARGAGARIARERAARARRTRAGAACFEAATRRGGRHAAHAPPRPPRPRRRQRPGPRRRVHERREPRAAGVAPRRRPPGGGPTPSGARAPSTPAHPGLARRRRGRRGGRDAEEQGEGRQEQAQGEERERGEAGADLQGGRPGVRAGALGVMDCISRCEFYVWGVGSGGGCRSGARGPGAAGASARAPPRRRAGRPAVVGAGSRLPGAAWRLAA